MILLAGRPILEYHLTWLRDQGVTTAVLLAGYRADVIQDYFGDGRRWGLSIEYSLEEEPLGRGGAFKLAFSLRAHRASAAVATVMLAPCVSPYGIVRVARDGRILRFDEKPRLPYWV